MLLVSGVTYRHGWNVANSRGADILIHGHVNSGAANQPDHYGAAFYRAGDIAAKDCAEHIRGTLRLLAIDRSLAIECPGKPAGHWTRNAHYVISGAHCPAITFEPFFIDAAEASHLREDPARVGYALADGILAWWISTNGK